MQSAMHASHVQPDCKHAVRHCASAMHSTELQHQSATAVQARLHQSSFTHNTGSLWQHVECNAQLHGVALKQQTPIQQQHCSPPASCTDLHAAARHQPLPGYAIAEARASAQQQQWPAAAEALNSRSSSDTQAGWLQEPPGQQLASDSEEHTQPPRHTQSGQPQAQLPCLPYGQHQQTVLIQNSEKQQQQQQHQQMQQQVGPNMNVIAQQQHQQYNQLQSSLQRLIERNRQQSCVKLLQALDSVRQPLLQAHSMVGEHSMCSETLLSVLAGTAAATGAVAVHSNSTLSECWRQLQTAVARQTQRVQSAQLRLQQQQHMQPPTQIEENAAAATAPHPGCEVPQHVADRLRQQEQKQQQERDATEQSLHDQQNLWQQKYGTRFRQLALASQKLSSAAAAADSKQALTAAVDGSSMLDAAERQRQQARKAAAAALAAAAPPTKAVPHTSAAASAAGRPPMPKPPKRPVAKSSRPAIRPWQPKPDADLKGWNKAAFCSVLEQADQVLCRNGKQLKPLPDQDTAKFVMLLLLHSAGWPNALLWQRWQAVHPKGEVALMVHMKAGVEMSTVKHSKEAIQQHKLHTQVDARWGDISLVEAQIDSMAEVLRRCPHVSHIGLASGHDIPVQMLKPGLLLPGVSLFGMYQFPDKEMRCLKNATADELTESTGLGEEEAQRWSLALMFHHQWMVLSREHAAALVLHKKEISVIGRVIHKACNSVKAGMAPDEFIILTALRAYGYMRSIQRVDGVKLGMHYVPGTMLNSYPTLVLFPAESSPHPVLWTDPDEKQECQVERQTGEQYFVKLSLMECLRRISVQRSPLFFRKVEIRQTCAENYARVLSCLEDLWHGRVGSSNKRSSRKGKRRRGSKDPINRLKDAAAGTDTSTGGSSAVDTAAGSESELDAADQDEAETPSKRACRMPDT